MNTQQHEQQKQLKRHLVIEAYKIFFDKENGDYNKIEKLDFSHVNGKLHIKNEVV